MSYLIGPAECVKGTHSSSLCDSPAGVKAMCACVARPAFECLLPKVVAYFFYFLSSYVQTLEARLCSCPVSFFLDALYFCLYRDLRLKKLWLHFLLLLMKPVAIVVSVFCLFTGWHYVGILSNCIFLLEGHIYSILGGDQTVCTYMLSHKNPR